MAEEKTEEQLAEEKVAAETKVAEEKAAGEKAAAEKKAAEGTFEVKIDGESKLLTLEELKTHATKSAGADELMRKAAEIQKSSKGGVEIKAAFDKILGEDVTASDVRNLATLMGLDPDEMVEMFEKELEKAGGKKGEKGKKAEKVGIAQFDDETKDIIAQAKQNQITQAEEKILEMCKESVDKDEIFGKMIKDTPEEQRADRRDVIISQVHRDVRGKILASPYTKEKFGTEMIQNSIQTVRSELKKYGIPSKSSKQVAMSNILASLGPTGGLPAEVQSDEKIERVPSTEAGYEDNVVKRFGQKMVQSLVNRAKS